MSRTELRSTVSSTITYYQPGSAVVLQVGPRASGWTQDLRSRCGSATGPAPRDSRTENGSIVLNRGEIEPSGASSPVLPLPVTARELTDGTHALELVSIEGRLLTSLRQSAQDEYVVVSGRHLFSAIYRHPDRTIEDTPPR